MEVYQGCRDGRHLDFRNGRHLIIFKTLRWVMNALEAHFDDNIHIFNNKFKSIPEKHKP